MPEPMLSFLVNRQDFKSWFWLCSCHAGACMSWRYGYSRAYWLLYSVHVAGYRSCYLYRQSYKCCLSSTKACARDTAILFLQEDLGCGCICIGRSRIRSEHWTPVPLTWLIWLLVWPILKDKKWDLQESNFCAKILPPKNYWTKKECKIGCNWR